jgi:hypothetical protein
MKSLHFLSVVIAGLLLVTAVGCTTAREIYEEDDYYRSTRMAPQRILVDDPFYGTMVLERDPFTGRYFPLGTMGMSPYGYRTMGVFGNNVYRTGPVRRQQVHPRGNVNATPAPSPQQREKSREEARQRVRGN